MFPLTFCPLSGCGDYTQFKKSVVDTQWKQSTHHLASALLKQWLRVLFKRPKLLLEVLWRLVGQLYMQPIR